MKLAIISDPHFHAYKAHSRILEDGRNSRLVDIETTFNHVVDESKHLGCEMLLITGDLFHVRGAMKPSVYNTVANCIKRASETGLRVVIIPGNHDMEDYNGGATAVDQFDQFDFNCTWVLKNETMTYGGVTIYGLGYCHTVAEFLEKSKIDLPVEFHHIVMIHQGIDDFKPSVSIPDTGFTFDLISKQFPNATVFAGHYHNHKAKGNVIQVGAMVQHNFGDEGQGRGFCVFDTDTKTNTFHPVDIAPHFITIEDNTTVSFDDGDFFRVNIKEKAKLKKALKALDGKAGDVVVLQQREIEHKAPPAIIKAGNVKAMLEEYAGHKFDQEKAKQVVNLYNTVCLGYQQ